MKINIFYDNVAFRIKGWRKIGELIKKVIAKESKISGDLNFIITDDKVLRKINVEFLKHNYCTDVISFNHKNHNNLFGEVYISIDSVKRNAKNYKVSYSTELLRVMIHGVLHLCDYNDINKSEKEEMSIREDYWLRVYKNIL